MGQRRGFVGGMVSIREWMSSARTSTIRTSIVGVLTHEGTVVGMWAKRFHEGHFLAVFRSPQTGGMLGGEFDPSACEVTTRTVDGVLRREISLEFLPPRLFDQRGSSRNAWTILQQFAAVRRQEFGRTTVFEDFVNGLCAPVSGSMLAGPLRVLTSRIVRRSVEPIVDAFKDSLPAGFLEEAQASEGRFSEYDTACKAMAKPVVGYYPPGGRAGEVVKTYPHCAAGVASICRKRWIPRTEFLDQVALEAVGAIRYVTVKQADHDKALRGKIAGMILASPPEAWPNDEQSSMAACIALGSHLVKDWMPKDVAEWKAYQSVSRTVIRGGILDGLEPDIIDAKGRWVEFLARLHKGAGIAYVRDHDGLLMNAIADVKDICEAFRAEILSPCVLRNTNGKQCEPMESKTAWKLLIGNKTLPAILELSRSWHEAVQGKKPNTPQSSWKRGLPDWQFEAIELRVLTTSEELANEGATMRHCVGGYSRLCVSGHVRIVSLRERLSELPVSTAEINITPDAVGRRELWVVQHRAHRNAPAPVAAERALNAYMKGLDERSLEADFSEVVFYRTTRNSVRWEQEGELEEYLEKWKPYMTKPMRAWTIDDFAEAALGTGFAP